MHEVKIMLDDSEFQVLTDQAEQNHRSLRAQAKHLVVGAREIIRTRRPSKPKYEVSMPEWVVPSWSVGNDDGEN